MDEEFLCQIENECIVHMDIQDIRFPTSLQADGSDAMHINPDYSCAYVTLCTSTGYLGNGLTFTCGQGTEIVQLAIKSLSHVIIGRSLKWILLNYRLVYRQLTSHPQLRWLGPECGVIHLATAAILNAVWDLWAKLVKLPVWRLLLKLTPEQLVNMIDFRYIKDAITASEAISMLSKQRNHYDERSKKLVIYGYPAYTTQIGWLGYSNEKVQELCEKYVQQGFKAFKAKVGQNIEDDLRRLHLIRQTIGPDKDLMVDANQVWEIEEAVEWMQQLALVGLKWIEEPTSPMDVRGHAEIRKQLKRYNIGVATGEACPNRMIFKQMLQMEAIDYCQIDSARLAGITEILSVYLMCNKFNVKVCPHAGGVGLCEMVQHLQMWDYVALSGTMEDRMIEYVDEQHEHFTKNLDVRFGCYFPPRAPGYGTTFKREVIEQYEYPTGSKWSTLFDKGLFNKP